MKSLEHKMVSWINGIVGFSVFLFVGGAYVFIGALVEDGIDPVFIKAAILVVLYVISLYLLSFALNRARPVKIFAWAFSMVFHAMLVVYLYFALELKVVTLWFLLPEITISILSLVTLVYILAKNRSGIIELRSRL